MDTVLRWIFPVTFRKGLYPRRLDFIYWSCHVFFTESTVRSAKPCDEISDTTKSIASFLHDNAKLLFTHDIAREANLSQSQMGEGGEGGGRWAIFFPHDFFFRAKTLCRIFFSQI